MASTEETLVAEVYRCYHCGTESTDSTFKYFDNHKLDQPRYQCQHCRKLFTLGSHGRPQGRTYAKKRNEDPPELKSLSRQCCHCGVADNAVFKYYNNRSLSQPRFKCLSCRRQFQMRLLHTGDERRLVPTAAQQTRAPRRRKQGVPEAFSNAASSSSEDGSYIPFDGSFMPVPFDPLMSLDTGTGLLPEMSDEDAQYVNSLETELAEEENTQASPESSWSADGDDGNYLPPPFGDEAAASLHLLEAELLTEENIDSAPNVADAFSSTTTVDGELPPTWSNEEVGLRDFIEAGALAPDGYMVSDHMAEMVSESTSNSAEVMYGILVVDSPAAFDSDTWSHNDSSVDASSMSYADAAAAVCHLMDLEMARKNAMLAAASVQSIGSENILASVPILDMY